jgi:hypothetical protein
MVRIGYWRGRVSVCRRVSCGGVSARDRRLGIALVTDRGVRGRAGKARRWQAVPPVMTAAAARVPAWSLFAPADDGSGSYGDMDSATRAGAWPVAREVWFAAM